MAIWDRKREKEVMRRDSKKRGGSTYKAVQVNKTKRKGGIFCDKSFSHNGVMEFFLLLDVAVLAMFGYRLNGDERVTSSR